MAKAASRKKATFLGTWQFAVILLAAVASHEDGAAESADGTKFAATVFALNGKALRKIVLIAHQLGVECVIPGHCQTTELIPRGQSDGPAPDGLDVVGSAK
ncbi:MAG: hypothetical protein WCJ66_01160 [Verrucomicrobiota bacterium]